MITQAIIEVFMLLPKLVISLLPSIEFTIPEEVIFELQNLFMTVGFILPVPLLQPLIALAILWQFVRVVLALIGYVRKWIPTLGG